MESFVNWITTVNNAVNGVVWGVPALALLIGTGILMTILTKGFQFTRFGLWMRETIGKLFSRDNAQKITKSKDKNSISQFGALCTALSARGITKLALGHHFDDAVETFLLSLVYEGRISCFQPVTHMTRTGVDQIRPMLYAGEGRIANLAKALALPIVENPCPEDRGSKRYEIKQFIRTMSQTYPDLRSKVFGAIQRAPLDGWEKAR